MLELIHNHIEKEFRIYNDFNKSYVLDMDNIKYSYLDIINEIYLIFSFDKHIITNIIHRWLTNKLTNKSHNLELINDDKNIIIKSSFSDLMFKNTPSEIFFTNLTRIIEHKLREIDIFCKLDNCSSIYEINNELLRYGFIIKRYVIGDIHMFEVKRRKYS